MAWAALAGLGLGLLKQKEEAEKARNDRILAGQTQALSPWTGLQAQKINYAPSLLAAAGEGALQGYQFGESLEDADLQKKLRDDKLNYYSRLRSPMGETA